MHATALADRDAAILSLVPLVRKLARRVASRITSTVIDVDDLASAGSLAAIRAVDAFDPSFGVPLVGYASRVILGAMYNEMRRADPVSERDRRTARIGQRHRHELQHELGHEPSLAEIEARCPGFQRALERCRRRETSYDAPLPHSEGYALCPLDFLRSRDDVAGTVIANGERVELHGAIASLDGRRRAVIAQHYFEERSLYGIAADLEVSPQRTSQLHLSALGRLQKRLAAGA